MIETDIKISGLPGWGQEAIFGMSFRSSIK